MITSHTMAGRSRDPDKSQLGDEHADTIPQEGTKRVTLEMIFQDDIPKKAHDSAACQAQTRRRRSRHSKQARTKACQPASLRHETPSCRPTLAHHRQGIRRLRAAIHASLPRVEGRQERLTALALDGSRGCAGIRGRSPHAARDGVWCVNRNIDILYQHDIRVCTRHPTSKFGAVCGEDGHSRFNVESVEDRRGHG